MQSVVFGVNNSGTIINNHFHVGNMAKQNHTAEEIVAFIRGLNKIERLFVEAILEEGE